MIAVIARAPTRQPCQGAHPYHQVHGLKGVIMQFRWFWVSIPLSILLCLWFLSGVSSSFSFADLGEVMGVVNESRYGQLAALGIISVSIVLVVKLWKAK